MTRKRSGPSQTGRANDHEAEVLSMSVTVIAHFPVADVGKAIEGLQAHAALIEEITEDTTGAGIIHHRFVAGADELVVIDEWESAEQFQRFFEGNPKVERVTSVIGVTGPPAVTVYTSFEAAGAI
jgi:heme-degrading monooxygenase HmoA